MEKQMVIAYIGNGKSANRYHIPFVLTRKDKIRIKKIYTMDHSLTSGRRFRASSMWRTWMRS